MKGIDSTGLLTATSAMLFTGTANAAFTGLSWTGTPGMIDGQVPFAPAPWAGIPLTTYRVYANFNNPLDALTAVFGNGSGAGYTALSLTNDKDVPFDQDGSGFFNNSFGGDEAPNAALAIAVPSILLDSHVSIGAVGQPDETSFSPGFPAGLINGNGVQNQTNMSWFTLGPLAQGTGIHVLIGQWTVKGPEQLSGNLGIQYRPAGASVDVQVHNQSFTTIPAPGILTLLSCAGAMSFRRRRA